MAMTPHLLQERLIDITRQNHFSFFTRSAQKFRESADTRQTLYFYHYNFLPEKSKPQPVFDLKRGDLAEFHIHSVIIIPSFTEWPLDFFCKCAIVLMY